MNAKTVIIRAIAVVTPIFAAFSGFLSNLAPPEDGPGSTRQFAVGAAAFASVVILLFVAALSQPWSRQKRRKVWIPIAGVCFLTGFPLSLVYQHRLQQSTVLWPPEGPEQIRRTKGSERHAGIQDLLVAKSPTGDIDMWLMRKFSSDFSLIWTRDSIDANRESLTRWYVLLAVLLGGTLVTLTEGVLVSSKPRSAAENAIDAQEAGPTRH